MNKILVVNVNWVGDVIFSTPIFKALRKKYPKAVICCLAVPRVKPILAACPHIDEIIVYDEKGKDRGPLAKLRLVSALRRKHFDIVFLLHRSWTRALLVYLAGIPQRIGYDTKKRGWMLTQRVEPLLEQVHRRDHYLHVIESCGIAIEDRRCELTVPPEARAEVEEILQQHNISRQEPLVVVNVGGNWDLKRWPKENFGAVIHRLANELKVKVVIPGAKKDVPLANEVAALSRTGAIVLAGKTGLTQLIALMQRASLVISSDSGPLHIANCVGTGTIALFGPTRPEVTGPCGSGETAVLQKDVTCNREPCYNLDCPDNVCMKAVTVDDCMEAAGRMLAARQGETL